MALMTTIIVKDKDWLKDQIERGIQGFFDMEGEYFVNLMMKYVYQQIYLSGCGINSESETDDPAKLQIFIDIPVPDECIDAIDNISRKTVHLDVWLIIQTVK